MINEPQKRWNLTSNNAIIDSDLQELLILTKTKNKKNLPNVTNVMPF